MLLKHLINHHYDEPTAKVDIDDTPLFNDVIQMNLFCKYYDLKIKSREIAAGELYYNHLTHHHYLNKYNFL